MTDVMIGIALLVGLAIVWLLWSRFQDNKSIKAAFEFEFAERDAVFSLGRGLREVIEYCDKNDIGYEHIPTPGFLVVEYDEKEIVVQQEGDFKRGNTFFSLKD